MKFLYAPWRNSYITRKSPSPKAATCIFCEKLHASQDEENFIITRREHAAVIMNLYPYNTAHVMIIPIKHNDSLDKYSSLERASIMELVNETITKIQEVFEPHGFNVGINLQKAAGAGIPEHLHIHVLPRWDGDTNFMPLIMGTKQISYDLRECYQKLKEVF